MNRLTHAALACVFAAGLVGNADAGEQEARAVVDKAIKAMGGEDRLSKIKAWSAKGRGTITLEGDDIAFTYETTARGLGQYRSTFEGEAGGEKFRGALVLDGDKGWRTYNAETMKLDGEALANEKRNAYLEIAPGLLLPLKSKEFKLDLVGDDPVGGKPATAVRVTGPDGKDFTVHFDKEGGLPIRVSGRVVDWEGEEFTQETMLEDYQDFDGVKVATRTRSKRDGRRYIEIETTEFKVLADVDPDAFAEPK
jgi:hypothetical protein